MALYSTASGITDRPEPMENLRANYARGLGLNEAAITLATKAPDAMIQAKAIDPCTLSCGQRGAYWLHGEVSQPGAHQKKNG